MRIEVFLRASPGVRRTVAGWECAALDLAVPRGPDEREMVTELGLASEILVLGLGRPRFRVPAWWLARSMPLAPGLLSSLARATRHIAVATSGWMAAAVALVIVAVATGLGSFAAIATVIVLLALSVLVHELGHVAAYRSISPAAGYLVTRGARCHLVRPPLPRGRETLVVVAGPLAPLGLAVLTSPLIVAAWLPWAGWLAVAVGHAVTLAIPVGDGRSLRRALRGSASREHQNAATGQ